MTVMWSKSLPAQGRAALACAGVFLFAWLLYANTLTNDFVWDDRTLIVENVDIRTLDAATINHLFTSHYWDVTGRSGGLYRPLSALSLHVDYQLYGGDAMGFHATNATLNACASVLVFLLVLYTFGRLPLALVAALLFASLPLHTENVAWVAGRTDVLATMFMLASLLAYAWWRRSGRFTAFVLSAAGFVAAAMAKEIALVLPPLILVLETHPFARLRREGQRGVSWARVSLTAIVFFGLAAGLLSVRKAILGSALQSFEPFANGFVHTAELSLSILAHYCYKLVWPFALNAEWDAREPTGIIDIHVLAGIGIAAFLLWATYRWRRRGVVVLSVAVFAIGIAPVLNIFPITEVSAERFLYFPSLGFCIAVAAGVVESSGRSRNGMLVFLVALLTAYSARTVTRNADWYNDATLFRKTAETASDVDRVHLNLGNVHYRAGRFHEALAEYEKAIELNANDARVWSGMAGAYKALGRLDDAVRCIQRALSIDPRDANLYNNLGMLQIEKRDIEGAIASFRRALERMPQHGRARFNLGLALYQRGEYNAAIEEFEALDHKEINYVHAYYYLAAAASKLGDHGRAASYAETFLKLYDRTDAFSTSARGMMAGKPPSVE